MIVLISSSIVVYQCQGFVREYMRRPVKTKTSMTEEGYVVFPAVTICNQNAFR